MRILREAIDEGRVNLSDVIDAHRAPMKPIHPGAILKHEFLDPLAVSAYRLAEDIGVPINRIATIVSGRRAITADTALRFARYFGTDAQSWINLQARYDIAVARRTVGKRITREVKPRAA